MKKRLKDYREESGKSKIQFAKELGIPYTTYLRYEENLGKAPFGEVAKICQILKITFQELAF